MNLALVNAYRSPHIRDWQKNTKAEYYYVYNGSPPSNLNDLTPLLFNLESHDFTDIASQLAAAQSIIFIHSAPNQDAATLAMHLCNLNYVKLPDGQNAWFRFYEPYVFKTFLHNCEPAIRNFIFSDKISAIAVPDAYTEQSKLFLPADTTQAAAPELPISINTGLFEKIMEAQHEETVRSGVLKLERVLNEKHKRESLHQYVSQLFDYALDNGITYYDNLIKLVRISANTDFNWFKNDQAQTIFTSESSQEDKMQHLEFFLRPPTLR